MTRKLTVDTGGPDDVFPGALVTWLHIPSGGYGFTMPLDAEVSTVSNSGLVWIKVTTKAGRVVVRRVDAANLRWRKP